MIIKSYANNFSVPLAERDNRPHTDNIQPMGWTWPACYFNPAHSTFEEKL